MKSPVVAVTVVVALAGGAASAVAPPVDTATRTNAEVAFAEWLTGEGIGFAPASVACALTGQDGSAVGLCYANNEEPGALAYVTTTIDSGATWVFAGLDELGADASSVADEGPGATAGSTIADGTWLVGTDIEPGTYRTLVPEGELITMCYWARLSDVTGEGIITNDIGSEPGQQMVVEILDTDVAFESSGCGTWEKIA